MTCAPCTHSHRLIAHQNRDRALCVLALLVKVTHPQVARRSVRAEGTTGVTRNAWSSGTRFFFFLPSRHGSALRRNRAAVREQEAPLPSARRSILDSVERTKPRDEQQPTLPNIRMATGNYPSGNSSPSPSLRQKNFPVGISMNTCGELFFPIPVPHGDKSPTGIPIPI